MNFSAGDGRLAEEKKRVLLLEVLINVKPAALFHKGH